MSGSGEYTTTPNLGLYKPTYNADAELWGDHLNLNADTLDAAIGAGGPFLPLSGGTLGNGTDAPHLNINGAAGSGHGVVFQEAGAARFSLVSAAADRALHLYGYDTGGGYAGEALRVDTANRQLWTEYKIDSFISSAPVSGGFTGVRFGIHNTGTSAAYGALVEYHSVAGGVGFDTGFGVVAEFNPVFQAGVPYAHEAIWMLVVSPDDTTHSWGGNIGELNYVNRGPDVGFKRDRAAAGNNTGGLLFVPEASGGTSGEGHNVGYAYAVSRSGGNNSTGFPCKTYVGFNAEPNSIVGLTGRAFYASGDITGVASQYPYGPFQTEGTWLHGFDTTLATFVDNSAVTLGAAHNIAWIGGGTTSAPTGVAMIGTFGSGASLGLWLRPASGGSTVISSSLSVGDGTGGKTVVVNGASGSTNGFTWQTGGTPRWQLVTDASDNLNLHSFSAGGGFLGTLLQISPTLFTSSVDFKVSGKAGFNGTAPITKPTGVAVTIAAVHAALVSYGLIAP